MLSYSFFYLRTGRSQT